MSRIRIELPGRFDFSQEFELHASHINHGGHLDSVQLLSIVSEARVRFFRWLGYSEAEVEGLAPIVADQAVQYRSQAFYGETVHVGMAADDHHKHGFDLAFGMHSPIDGREIARGKIGIVFVNLSTGRAVPSPPAFHRALSEVRCREEA